MKRKIILSVLVALLLLMSVTWFYQIVWTMALVAVWRKHINAKLTALCQAYAPKVAAFLKGLKRLTPATLLTVLLTLCLFHTAPRYRVNTNDRVRLIYQDEDGNPVNPPLHHYLLNCVLQEAEVEGFTTKLVSVMPIKWLSGLSRTLRLGLTYFRQYQESGLTWRESTRYYRELEGEGCFTMSGCAAQCANMVLGTNTRSVYLILPKNYDESKTYPLAVFAHGFLGNWQMYAGMLKDMEGCVVLCFGTRDLSGIFGRQDVADVFGRHKRFLDTMGVKIDWANVHLAGLSNGGTASNVAHAQFGNKFKSVTYISTGVYTFANKSAAIYVVCGGQDGAVSSAEPGFRKIKANGAKCDMFYKKDANHYLIMSDWAAVSAWLGERWK